MISGNLSDLRILIVTLSQGTEGNEHQLERYLVNRCKVIALLSHPYTDSPVKLSFLSFTNNRSHKKVTFRRCRNVGVLSHAVNIFVSFYLIFSIGHTYDLYFSTNALYTLLGLFLRKVGMVKKVVFYSIEYSLRRFENQLLNWIYHKLDQICVSKSDYVWNNTPHIIKARKKKGLQLGEGKQITAPFGFEPQDTEKPPMSKIEEGAIVYIGGLDKKFGFELIMDALPEVIKKKPQVKITVVSYHHFPEEWKKRIRKERMEDNFKILGFIKDEIEVRRILREHSLGLAPYRPDRACTRYYSDSGKIKTYMSQHLPVIVTRFSSIAEEIERERAGLVINYDREELTNAILKLLSDEQMYRECRENAAKLMSKYRTNVIFNRAFKQMGIKDNFLCL